MSDAVERLVRDLIRENQLSRARGVLSIFHDDYPHLLLELEAASGNWMAVLKIYERLSEEKKEEYKTLYKTAQERVKENYKEDVKDSFEEMDRANLEGAMAILEAVSKSYPELVEVVALKLELARRKGDKAREKIFEELLRKLDSSHPSLSGKVERTQKRSFDLVILVLICATLVFSVVGLLRSGPSRAVIETVVKEQIAPVSEKVEGLKETSNQLVQGVTDLESKFEGISKAQLELSQSLAELKLSVNDIVARIQSGEQKSDEIMNEIKQLLARIDRLAGTGATGEKIQYSIHSRFDVNTARSIWLFGYDLYRKGYYLDAAEILKNLFEQLSEEVYFKDDVYYYMGLSYYSEGKKDEAKKTFEDFLRRYPESLYAPHARYFLSKIE
ncbi:hypothetical protein AS159_06290 [Thermotoga sp. Ku-13t]|uniref:tetratricopeptide repeat protein n=1 Tax=Thermotoga sp. Ku-13t TaxID=1755813 RepID=UPI0013EA4BA2|nr:tetratricopeptide repeat protein [Thermotoga sp. Ku-13t]KAF2957993.1 hypothetical protein AS159_06290 [Thermotoga sp. Ku-13t]